MEINFGAIILAIVVIVIAIAILWWIMSKLYQRSTTEQSFVRTGFLGGKVVISGGAFVIPVLHEITRVNMNTMRISVSHRDENALITQDRLRVNVDADFYIRVTPEKGAVNAAARSLGSRTSSVDAIRSLLEARFNDALRTAAAQQTMEALHEDRGAFSAKVKELALAGMSANGLEIDKVSISKFDQASREFFNPNNAFDAAGLTKLTSEIEERRKRRNEIERDSQVAIQRKNLEAEQQMLELQKEEEYARLMQEREIAVRRAMEQSQITVEAAEMKRASEVAEVSSAEAVEKARLGSDRSVREERVRVEQQIKEIEIRRSLEIELAETKRMKAIEIARQETEIEIAENSKRRNTALASAEETRAQTVKAEESVISARELERAEREKALALIAAAREVEAKGMEVVKSAEAERDAAEQQAERIRLMAQAEAEAAKLKTQSLERKFAVEAQGRRDINEAENVMSAEAMALRAKLAAIDRIETVIRESAKPLENISEIKIMHVDGLNGSGSAGGSEAGDSKDTLSDQVMKSALKYRLQAPLVDSLLDSAGIPSTNPASLLKPDAGH